MALWKNVHYNFIYLFIAVAVFSRFVNDSVASDIADDKMFTTLSFYQNPDAGVGSSNDPKG